MYHIVEFTDSSDPGSCDIIPVAWFTQDKNSCYWPPFRSTGKVTKAVKNMATPMDNWPVYNIRKIGTAIAEYGEARKLCRKAEVTSDLQSDIEVSCKRKRRDNVKNIRYSSSDTEDSGTDVDELPPPPKRQPESRSRPAIDKDASQLDDRELTPPPVFPSMSVQQQHPSIVPVITGELDNSRIQKQSKSTAKRCKAASASAASIDCTRSRSATPASAASMDCPRVRSASSASATSIDCTPVRSASSASTTSIDRTRFESPTPASAASMDCTRIRSATPANSPLVNEQTGMKQRRTCTKMEGVSNRLLLGLVRGIQEIKSELACNTNILRTLLQQSRVTTNSCTEIPHQLKMPLTSERDVDAAELVLQEDGVADDLVSVLANIGGKSLMDMLKRVFPLLMTTSLERKFSLVKPPEGKIAFKPLRLFRIVCRAIRTNIATSRYSQAELEEQMSQYFINARDRSGGRKERSARRRQQQLSGETSVAGSQTAASTLLNSS